MAVTEERIIDNPSWAQRLGTSFKGVLAGLALFVAGFPILFWNEGRAVDTGKSIAELAAAAVNVSADKVDAANEGKPVHVSGKADTQAILTDAVFGVSTNALRLMRTVEVYQTVEHSETKREKRGDKTIERTTYTYSNEWCDKPVDSSNFHEEKRRTANPPAAMPFFDADWIAPDVTLGAFTLSERHVKRMGEKRQFAFPVDFKPPATVPGGQYQNGYIYVPFTTTPSAAPVPAPASSVVSPLLAAAQAATNVSAAVANAAATAITGGRSVVTAPVPGDVRVRFDVVLPHDVTFVERQEGNSLVQWVDSRGNEPPSNMTFSDGRVSLDVLAARGKSRNKMLTWLLRLVGLLVMYFGLKKVLGPLDTLVDAIPILNGIIAMGTSLVAGLVSAACALITIGVAWIYYRPWIGIPLVAGGLALLVTVFLKKRKAAAAAA